MELTKQERELEKSTAEAHGSLSLGMFATALLVNSTSEGLWWISFVILGTVLALSSLYLALIHKWKRKRVLVIAANVQIKHVAWFLGFAALGIGLILTEINEWVIPGLICICLAYAILIIGIAKNAKEALKARKLRIN